MAASRHAWRILEWPVLRSSLGVCWLEKINKGIAQCAERNWRSRQVEAETVSSVLDLWWDVHRPSVAALVESLSISCRAEDAWEAADALIGTHPGGLMALDAMIGNSLNLSPPLRQNQVRRCNGLFRCTVSAAGHIHAGRTTPLDFRADWNPALVMVLPSTHCCLHVIASHGVCSLAGSSNCCVKHHITSAMPALLSGPGSVPSS